MKYILVNPKLDALIVQIRRKIRLSMNGIVSDQMTQNGIHYKKNYGVSIPRIKEMAAGYPPGHDLAQRLWNLQIRETMIMATVLEPVDSFTPQMAQEWVRSFDQIEIIEQACMNLFCKLPYSNTLCLDWIHSDSVWVQVTGFLLAARIVGGLTQIEIDNLIRKAVEISETNNYHLYRAVALCLSRFCRKDNETATYILKEITAVSNPLSTGQQYILNEVKQEILFLNNL
jgi:3-methyladenine DNA glycosylase AlkD